MSEELSAFYFVSLYTTLSLDLQLQHVIELASFTSLFPFPLLFLGPRGQEWLLEAGSGSGGKLLIVWKHSRSDKENPLLLLLNEDRSQLCCTAFVCLLLLCVTTVIINQASTCVWVCFWTLHFVLSVCLFMFIPIPHSLKYCSLDVSMDIQ